MSRVSKEKQTAYQRWEMASFDEKPANTPDVQGEVVATVETATPDDMEVLLENLRNNAQKEGFEEGKLKGEVAGKAVGIEKGYKEGVDKGFEEGIVKGRDKGFDEGMGKGFEEGTLKGHAKGYEEGLTKGHKEGHTTGYAEGHAKGYAKGQAEAEQMLALASNFANQIARADKDIAEDVLKLSLEIAQAMLKTALPVKPDLVVPIVKEAIRYLPSVQQPALLYLNAEDAVLVRASLKEELAEAGWRVIEDDIELGSCRVETANNEVDCSFATRWSRIVSALGQSLEWIEP